MTTKTTTREIAWMAASLFATDAWMDAHTTTNTDECGEQAATEEPWPMVLVEQGRYAVGLLPAEREGRVLVQATDRKTGCTEEGETEALSPGIVLAALREVFSRMED